jgi:hypothetical protein
VATYQARDLSYDEHGGRAAAWNRLGQHVQDRLRARVGGEIIDWWAAREQNNRVSATVLGPAGLCLALPFSKDDGRAAYRLELTRLDPGSLRFIEVKGSATAPAPRASEPSPAYPLSKSLAADLRGFLGHLPARVQSLLQEPFASGGQLVHDYYYERTLELNKTVWWFGCYLSDQRTLTFASGTRITQAGQPDANGIWDAACHRATILRPG